VRLSDSTSRPESLSAAAVRRRDERGASALELAFLAPALLLLIFFTIQGALFFYGRNVAIQSAREGVSQIRLAQDADTYADIHDRVILGVQRFAHNVGREALIDPRVIPRYDGDTGRVSVTVTGHVITLVPGLHLSVTERAYGVIERFDGGAGG